MWNFIKRILRCIFPWCFRAKPAKPADATATDPLLHTTQDEDDAEHLSEAEAQASTIIRQTTTANIQQILAEDDAAFIPKAAKKPVRVPSLLLPLTAHEKSVIIAAASCGSNVYLDALDEAKQTQATDVLMESIQTSFSEISTCINDMKTIAKQQEQQNYTQLSSVEQLRVSWNSMSRDILHTRNGNEKSINYRCEELISRATDPMIYRLVKEVMSIFARCKSMLSSNIFTKQSHASNLKEAKPASDDNATTSEGQFFNNANRKTLAILDRFNQDSDTEDASLAHQSSPTI